MKKALKISYMAGLLLAIMASCATNLRAVFYKEKPALDSTFTLGEVTATPELTLAPEGEIRSLQFAAASLAQLNIQEQNSTQSAFKVDVLYRDVQWNRGFRRLHSLALILTIKTSEGIPVAKIYTMEEGEDSFESISTTVRITESAWMYLYRELKRQ